MKACALLVLAAARIGSAEEPNIAAPPFLKIEDGQPGKRLQVNFPPSSHSDADRATYWLTAKEPLSVDIQLSMGGEPSRFPMTIRGALVIAGRQTRVKLDRAAELATFTVVIPAAGYVKRFAITAAGSRISRGVQTAALLFWGSDGAPFPCWAFTIVKDSVTRAVSHSGPSFIYGAAAVEDAVTLRMAGPGGRLLIGRPFLTALASDQTVRIEMQVQRAPRPAGRPPVGVTLLALLDGRQVAFSDRGTAPRVVLGPGETASGEMSVGPLPGAGAHQLLFFEITDPAAKANSAEDGFVVVRPPRQVGGMRWGS
jgi:hypothetical protein